MLSRLVHCCPTKHDGSSHRGFDPCFAPSEELPSVTLSFARQTLQAWNTPWTHTCHTCSHPWTGLLMEP